ncbi:hypothetical protein ISN45_Aa03g037330 [Arabidopsis thaliana x Arabidopsis arenosa]|uniref:peptidylprolyl isomerase n=1 Tax=Arabidopsis thaliana x Arabidopsis arenosa TaxID=1240361 RepID=A0A8T2AZ47_9BRAS|nr:hypothetical protein ISN45_Aa03g037330 [Arabidopsis thaliana x Arabidopsis arenosa]
MAFWGVEVEPGKPFTLKATEATRIRRLHLSHATLGGIGNETARHILVCNVGNRRPLYLCILSPGKVDSCQLNLDFEEADEVIFSVIGPLSIHITGYFLPIPTAFRLNDDVQGFSEMKRSDGLLEFGNENFVRGQPMLMKEMHQKAMMKRINKDLTVFKAQRR